jgi:hypothetical protein
MKGKNYSPVALTYIMKIITEKKITFSIEVPKIYRSQNRKLDYPVDSWTILTH